MSNRIKGYFITKGEFRRIYVNPAIQKRLGDQARVINLSCRPDFGDLFLSNLHLQPM